MNEQYKKKLLINGYKTGKLVIRLDNINTKRIGQSVLFRMMAISLGNHAGIKRKDVIKECKLNEDKYIEIEYNGSYKELYDRFEDYKGQVLKTNFLLSIKKALIFMNKEDKQKAADIENNKTWDKVEEMLLLAGISFTYTFYDKKGRDILE